VAGGAVAGGAAVLPPTVKVQVLCDRLEVCDRVRRAEELVFARIDAQRGGRGRTRLLAAGAALLAGLLVFARAAAGGDGRAEKSSNGADKEAKGV
jgi:hypothetical protein